MVVNRDFWRNKRVFITGSTGFKGSWLCLWLQSMGAKVVGYSNVPPTNPSLYEQADVGREMVSITGDVRDYPLLERSMKQHSPEIVIHMAAQPIVRTSYKNPLDTFSTNVMGTANVLEAVRQTESVRVTVCITSDKCYRNQEWHWGYREDEQLGGHDPYSGSKACAEIVAATYRDAYFADVESRNVVATARAGNVLGGGDWAADRLVPDTMRSFIAGQAVCLRYPKSTRPWQHVLVPLSGYLQLAEQLWHDRQAVAEAWNFGPNEDDAQPVVTLVSTMSRMWGEGADWSIDKGAHPHEDCYLKLDCSKARGRLKWVPKLELEETLDWCVQWYKGWANGESAREITLAQIKAFEAILRGEERQPELAGSIG
jgi:CDP-glucose 4,6-dehydratase